VQEGKLQGTIENGLTIYRGIPLAAPPLGDLRWRAPQPAAKWQGVRSAHKFAPQCVQSIAGITTSEDCLYLNVWSPAKKSSYRIPVLVWIYGGGFSVGGTAVPTYSGEKLAQKGVLLVSIGYRLGALGFLAHPELSAESPQHVSGNYGLLDMIAALQWIKKNIAAFGGDPDKVTIFGELAGGIAVSQLCASPLAKGLIEGAISESGGSFGPTRSGGGPGENMRPLADAERSGAEFQASAGASSIAELRKLPPEKSLPLSSSARPHRRGRPACTLHNRRRRIGWYPAPAPASLPAAPQIATILTRLPELSPTDCLLRQERSSRCQKANLSRSFVHHRANFGCLQP
jgi:para-nitrobenzyl esterase